MLEDRDYMRQPEYGRRRSLTVALLIVNAIVFVFELLVSGYSHSLYIENHYFALSKEGLESGFVWQLFTFQFMHAGLWHLVFNCWAIYVFGRAIEETLGWKKFLILYLSSGVVGGICQVLAALLWPGLFGGPVVGASAGGFGLIAAFAVLFPERELVMLLFFILPIRLSAKMLLMLSAVLALAGIIFPFDHIANAAHLGGMLTGVVFIRQFIQGRWMQSGFPSGGAVPGDFITGWPGKSSLWRSASNKPDEDLSTDEFVKSEVDPILDKISRHGIQSLTAREREILEKARARMAKH
ncbi:MAG: rhomboid family intramembrane serine protease [Verrucomicrobiota bacterium]|jgi:membrane associated rhomboid family serine protease